MDSLEVWKQEKNLKAIVNAAKTLLEKPSNLTACDRMKIFLAASEVSFDLYEPEDCLLFARAGREIPFSQCADSILLMELILREAVGLNLLEHPEKARSVALTEKVIHFAERRQHADLQYTAYTHLGMMLNKSGEFEKARGWFLKAFGAMEKSPEPRRKAISLSNIALCDLNLNQFRQGLELIDSAIYLAEQAKSRNFLAYCYGLKSAFHKELGDEKGWEAALDNAITMALEAGNRNQATMGMADKLKHYTEKGDFKRAVGAGSQVLNILQGENQFPNLAKNIYLDLFTAYKGIGDHQQAGYYLQQYVHLKDSLDNAEFEREIYELNLKYEVQEKDNELLQKRLDLKNSRMMLGGALAGVFLLFMASAFIYWRSKYQKQVIHSLFKKERALELEIQRLQSLYPGTLSEPPVEPNKEDTNFKLLFLEACKVMENEKLYLEPELDIHDLVKRLNTNRRYLSQAINQYAVDGFRSFVNRYRVEQAKSIIWSIASGKSTHSLGDIWNHVGMNSIQNFYRVFKSITGLTPKEYLDQVKLELSLKTLDEKPDPEENGVGPKAEKYTQN